jgi:undecaprenyl phosphate N,N'-diacetylbacillosamine 1-phosphate transferase
MCWTILEKHWKGINVIIRLLDIFISIIAIILLWPIFVVVYVCLVASGVKPVFKQLRLGQNGVEFHIYKFTTMRPDLNDYFAVPGDNRVTKFGKFLRKSHIDELPQIFNVLAGEMSIVGPRPFRRSVFEMIMVHEKNFYKRLTVKPGITGLAQVECGKGEELADHVKKLKYDLIYINSRYPLIMYFKILISTIRKIFSYNSH